MTSEGAACVADDQLAIAKWGTDRPVSEQMADAMAGVVGEFDTPDPEAELRAVRFLLFIGFGAEARQMLTQFRTDQPAAPVLSSIAAILDDRPDAAPAFRGMAACDTVAALWALLADPAPARGETLDRGAVLRGFSALPVHLRRWLGPPLVERLLARGDSTAAQSVRDAILRAPGDAGPEIEVMEAQIDLKDGNPVEAENRLAPLITTSGPATDEALLAMVATHLAQRTPVDADQITALDALAYERGATEDAARFALAATQARALSGDFESAFADLAEVPQAITDVWTLLAELGPDSDLLNHAILPAEAMPDLPAPVAVRLAERLSGLGFAGQASNWLQRTPSAENATQTELASRIALQTGDARAAVRLMAGSQDPALRPLRVQALEQLADHEALADLLTAEDDAQARWLAVGRARDWPQLAASGPEPWQELAQTATPPATPVVADPAAPGPLAAGEALLASSAETRQQVSDLLATVPGPRAPGL